MSILRKISVFTMLFMLSFLMLAPANTEAATVGSSLTSPEDGWTRYDEVDDFINYSGTGVTHSYNTSTTASYYNYTITDIYYGSKAYFKFNGTGIRIIGVKASSSALSRNVICVIDGIAYTYNNYNSTRIAQCLLLDVTGLNSGIHTVEIYSGSTDYYTNLDAVDVKNGYLVDYYQPTNLTATAGDTQVTLTWDAVDDTTSYIVKRSTASGIYDYEQTIDESDYIVSGSSIVFTDTGLTNDTAYYYVISAVVDGEESSNSEEVSATPTTDETPSTDHTGNYSTLILSMTNGDDKEYDLSINDLDDFITWYINKSSGTGNAYYIFNITDSIAPYVSVKEYIAFDKISSFEVKEFNQ